MTADLLRPDALAALHARAFVVPRPWSVAEMAALLKDAAVVTLVEPWPLDGAPLAHPALHREPALAGFVMFRGVLGEYEILTVAVDPAVQGQGIGGRLMASALDEMRAQGAERAFLEVAETNVAARALYSRAGFSAAGRRRGYYVTQGQGRIDALVLARVLPGF